jgi:hypothetical protein
MAKPTSQELIAAVLTEIHLGIAMARAAGVVCGSPQNIKIARISGK